MAAPQAVALAAVVHYCDTIAPVILGQTQKRVAPQLSSGFIDIEPKRNYSNYMV